MGFTNREILRIAMRQSALDANSQIADFCKNENVIVISSENPSARKYLKLPFDCNLISYGNNIVASIKEEYKEIVESYINKYFKLRT
jgi:UDP-N-acetylmuramyl pentapeptide synthase